jgi:hypothetical protein
MILIIAKKSNLCSLLKSTISNPASFNKRLVFGCGKDSQSSHNDICINHHRDLLIYFYADMRLYFIEAQKRPANYSYSEAALLH